MKYRRFGKLDWRVSALGFGMMRLPTVGGKASHIDDAEATRMVRFAIDQGVNYVDTAWMYHQGTSEPFLGRALQDGYRDKVRVATKLPCWLVKTAEHFDYYLNEQLRRLQIEHIDFYLLHSLDKDSWTKVHRLGVLPWAESAVADGRIGHLGFSFHDEYEVFQHIIDAYDGWDFCQIQHNYMDIERQAGTKGLQYAASKGLGVVIMEPLLGGRLANPPAHIQALWDKAPPPPWRDAGPTAQEWERTPVNRTAADWALQWLWDQPKVSVVLSGMSAMQQVEENLASADRSGIGTLNAEEMALVARVREWYKKACPIPCTNCRYCMPCPSGVDIPRVFEVFNNGLMHDDPEGAREGYRWVDAARRASNCTQCLQCEELCPQHIPISEWMVHVEEVLAHGKPYESCLPGR
jgi:predicted aldo/keto reductase-like oxidoreductase